MDTENFYIHLGTRIKFLREQAGLTQEQLADKAEISLDFLGKIEVNINKPGLRSLIKIAEALSIHPKNCLILTYASAWDASYFEDLIF